MAREEEKHSALWETAVQRRELRVEPLTASNGTFFSGGSCGRGDRGVSSLGFAFSGTWTAAKPGFSGFQVRPHLPLV